MRRALILAAVLFATLAGALTKPERSAYQWLAPIDRDTPAGEMLDRLWKATQALAEGQKGLEERGDVHAERLKLLEREVEDLRRELAELRRSRP